MRARAVTSEACGCCSISARNNCRASPKRPREKSLCARSNARIAAISSLEGLGLGAGLGGVCGRVGGAACFVVRPLTAGAWRNADFAAGRLAALVVALPLAALLAGGAFFAGLSFAVCLPFVAFGIALLAELLAFLAGLFAFLVALRTGGLAAPVRLARGLERAAFACNLRLLAVDAEEALRVAGRGGGRLTPLMMDSLMRSSRFSKWLTRDWTCRLKACETRTG